MGRGGNPCILRSFPKGGKFQMTHNYYIKNETVKEIINHIILFYGLEVE